MTALAATLHVFFPETFNALKTGLPSDHNTNIYQLIPSDVSKQALRSSLSAFYCIVTATFFKTTLQTFFHII